MEIFTLNSTVTYDFGLRNERLSYKAHVMFFKVIAKDQSQIDEV